MWTYERTMEGGRKPYRAFVSLPVTCTRTSAARLPGHPAAGGRLGRQRTDVDTFLKEEERGDALRYISDGPRTREGAERLEFIRSSTCRSSPPSRSCGR